MAKVYFKYGAMNCGKTTALLQTAYNFEEKGKSVAIIKSSIDKKGDNNIVSRIGLKRKVDYLIEPDMIIKNTINFKNLDCILVDEAQFLTRDQVVELWIIANLYDIPVIGYGLKTNFQGELFEGSKAFIELSDDLEELSTLCECGKKARFNARLINGEYVIDGDVVAIDGIDAEYNPLCGKCFIDKVLKLKKY